ncbi:MAG: adenylate/guanylate cyclase domain-containing protein [Nannocystis sp.]|nr:adenylate/guanylate cyclase domain-containing protein [Nannocystis sp.]
MEPLAPAAGAPDSRLINDFLHAAEQRGEMSVSAARIILCLAFLAMHLPQRAALLVALDPKSWILISGYTIGLIFSLIALRWSRRGAVTTARIYTSVLLDAALVYLTLTAGVLWPHLAYAGILREHEAAIIYIAIIASAVRLSTRGAVLGAVIHGLGLTALLLLDRSNSAILDYGAMTIVIAATFFVVAAILAVSIAHRTRALVRRGADSAVLAERARQRLGVYVSEAIADASLDEAELYLGGASRRAALLFSDLRGFTRYAERLPPEQLVDELNGYLSAMVREIRAEHGVVDKYMGDAIMAVFGLPTRAPHDAIRAIRAATRMQVALTQHNRERAARGLPALVQGIGVHYGPMIAGNIGTPERMQYTVIGDVVNLTSRLEAATKDEGVGLLISADAVEAARRSDQPLPALRRHASLVVRGRDQPIEVYTLDPDAPAAP